MMARGYEVSLRVNEHVLKSTVMMVAHLLEYTENHRISREWLAFGKASGDLMGTSGRLLGRQGCSVS